jgi:hypothetical protein
MSGVYKLANVSVPRNVAPHLPRGTGTVSAYAWAVNPAAAALAIGGALGIPVRPGSLRPATDTVSGLLVDTGTLFTSAQPKPTALVHGPIHAPRSVIIKVSGFAVQIVARIEGTGTNAVLRKGDS